MRHGESTWNAEGRMQRQIAHPPLTERGALQAYAAGDTLRDTGIDRIVTSDAVRATQTARAVAQILEVPVSVDVRLRERGWAEPGHLEDPAPRVLAALSAIAISGDRVAVVTHGDIVYLLRDMLCATQDWETGSDVPHCVAFAARPQALSGRQ
ncbi:MAG: histidine phosphatase family protein [Mycolicibacterium cosmeticum]|nr:histidine phosphatase family protein [Mycolicibacterium cosmeticum]